jgi:hypothetical protein
MKRKPVAMMTRNRRASLVDLFPVDKDVIMNTPTEVTLPTRVDADREHEDESEARTSDDEEDTKSVVMSDVGGSDGSGDDIHTSAEVHNADDLCCTKCGIDDHEELLMLCDGEGCTTGYHTFCLTPMLAAIPDGDWLCPTCEWFAPVEVVVVPPVDPALPDNSLPLLLLAPASLVAVDTALITTTTTTRRRVKNVAMWKAVLEFRPWMRRYHTAATGGYRHRKKKKTTIGWVKTTLGWINGGRRHIEQQGKLLPRRK